MIGVRSGRLALGFKASKVVRSKDFGRPGVRGQKASLGAAMRSSQRLVLALSAWDTRKLECELLVSPVVTPKRLPYTVPYMTPFKRFRQ